MSQQGSRRPKHIITSEEKVSQVKEVIEQEYENSFGIHVDKEKFINISSGIVLEENTKNIIWFM